MSASAEEVLRQLAALNRISRIALQDMALRPMLQRIVDALNAEFGWAEWARQAMCIRWASQRMRL